MKFKIKKNPHELVIRQTQSSRVVESLVYIFVFIITLLILTFPIEEVTRIHKYLVLVYLIPLITLIGVIWKIVKLMLPHRFNLNSKTDQILFNDRIIDRLTNIKQVEWNIDSISNHENSYLELKTIDNRKHRISTTSTLLNKEHLNLGRTIAKFLKVKFINNHPWEDDILWDNNDVNEKSIDHLENKNY